MPGHHPGCMQAIEPSGRRSLSRPKAQKLRCSTRGCAPKEGRGTRLPAPAQAGGARARPRRSGKSRLPVPPRRTHRPVTLGAPWAGRKAPRCVGARRGAGSAAGPGRRADPGQIMEEPHHICPARRLCVRQFEGQFLEGIPGHGLTFWRERSRQKSPGQSALAASRAASV